MRLIAHSDLLLIHCAGMMLNDLDKETEEDPNVLIPLRNS